ncbi:uncharacterized protein [Physcomitrium patens]|uniref:Uncharacterized protein n=1 Tax=Physcomitrium patens TaxID=3218 RepID=A0A2K1JDX8_PHYPA|nr:uncharacterized protein LOC112292893 [Physcomitrium patens]PNR39730.1 hypothetical protein PHYPA_020009 [Physcomitrium patens]|eukprot:XP_024397627.1 uncharacterized protein LOC112292893 [Physcomitrella patens]
MEPIRLDHGSGFQGARKLFVQAPAPSPVGSVETVCRDVRTNTVVSCHNPHTLIIIMAGMSCMMFLIAVALVLLCWSIVKQRQYDRRHREPGRELQSNPSRPHTAIEAGHATLVDSSEYDDAVLVHLPGDEKPQFFALRKPFPVESGKGDDKKLANSAGDSNSSDKGSPQAPG